MRTARPALVLALVACGLLTPAVAQQYVLLGPSDNVAVDQPRATVSIYKPPPDGTLMGPGGMGSTWLLDTGSQGLLVSAVAIGSLTGNGYQTVCDYQEAGVGGYEMFRVSQPYDLTFMGDSGPAQGVPGVRFLSSTTNSLGGFGGIVGMTGLNRRVASMNLSDMIGGPLGIQPMTVGFSTAPPAGSHRYTVPLTLQDFPAAGQQHPGDPLPTLGPLPFLQGRLRTGAGGYISRPMLLDTGAQTSLISTATAIALGMDADHDGQIDPDRIIDYLPVQGVGGEVDLPVVAVDRLAVPTTSGVTLVWTDLQVAVLDIDPAIPVVFGMDLLTSGWWDAIIGAIFGEPGEGYLRQVHLDLARSNPMTGQLLLDLSPDKDSLSILPADVDGSLTVDFTDYQILESGFGATTGATWGMGDFDGDGAVDFSDYQVLESNFGSGVPEPACLSLLATGGLLLCRRRQAGNS